jgi:hypothetical protein
MSHAGIELPVALLPSPQRVFLRNEHEITKNHEEDDVNTERLLIAKISDRAREAGSAFNVG